MKTVKLCGLYFVKLPSHGQEWAFTLIKMEMEWMLPALGGRNVAVWFYHVQYAQCFSPKNDVTLKCLTLDKGMYSTLDAPQTEHWDSHMLLHNLYFVVLLFGFFSSKTRNKLTFVDNKGRSVPPSLSHHHNTTGGHCNLWRSNRWNRSDIWVVVH